MNDLSTLRAEAPGEAASIVARGLRRPALAPVGIALLAICLDLPVFATALWFAQYGSIATRDFAPLHGAALAVAGALAATMLLALSRSYRLAVLRRAGPSMVRAAAALSLPVAVFVAILDPAGPAALAVALATLAIVIVPTRLGAAAMASWMLDTGLLDRRAVIAGGGAPALDLVRGLAARPGNDIRIHGLFDDRDDLRSPVQVLGVPKIGGYDDLIAFVRASEIDMVIIALPLDAEARINWLLDAFRVLPVEIRLSACSRDFAFGEAGRDPLISAMRRSFAPERRLTKRAFDLVIASIALILLSPLMLAAAAAVRIESRGPILFRQKRHGYNHREIEVLKFRSMYHDQADPASERVVSRGDPRVTRVGRFLRRSSIDELPQLVNVLRGELSLVGPRPHAINAMSSRQERFERMIHGYSARHRLPPGITGWAQINGWRGEIDDPAKLTARFDHDLYYIENWSLWLDVKILLRTPISLLDTRSAY